MARPLIQEALSFNPTADLAARFHLELARIALDERNQEEGVLELKKVQAAAPDSTLSARASDILARLATEEGDLTTALSLFAQAARHPDTDFAEQAILNQAVVALNQNAGNSLSALSAKLKGETSKESLELEKALAAARSKSDDAVTLLQDFITMSPTHFRIIAEARLGTSRTSPQSASSRSRTHRTRASLPACRTHPK